MEALPGWQLDAQALLPSELGNFETTELGPGSVKDSVLSINDSAHEGVSSRDSGEHSPETEGQTKRQGSTGEKTAKLAATANGRNKLAQKRYRERQRGKMETYKQQVEGLSRRLSELQTENESLEKRNRLLEKVVQMKDQKPKTPVSIEPFDAPANNLWQNTDTYAAVADYINTVRKQRLPLLTAQEAAHISPEDLRAIRADYVKEIATLLLAHGDNQASDGYKQLEDYVLQTRLASMNLFSSMSVRSFAQVLALKKRMSMGGSISERIMMAMNLSPDQKRDFVKARQALIARNEDIKEKRRRIVGDLELAVPSIAPLMCGQTAAMLRACESSDQFKASLEEEHRSMATFHIECHQVLTPLQEARALLEAHPGNPDPWLISGYLEAEQSGNLKGWLAVHTNPGRSMLDLQAGEVKTESPTTSGYPSSPFSNEMLSIVDGLANGSLAGQQPGADMMFPGDGPLEMPLQKITQGSQDILPATSLDVLDSGLENFATDDMWVDFFPGLLTQTQT